MGEDSMGRLAEGTPHTVPDPGAGVGVTDSPAWLNSSAMRGLSGHLCSKPGPVNAPSSL